MSDDKKRSSLENWTNVQAYTLAVICLLVGVGGGWLFRGSQSPAAAAPVNTASAAPPVAMGVGSQPTPEQLKRMADVQVAPLIEKLKSDPNNPDLLAGIGNSYYDAQQYQPAIEYYERALQSRPSDAGIRTDMATAYWYLGNADKAIEQFNKSLAYEPLKPNTLFNLGMVKWQGKMDIEGAVAVWQKLLDTNPNYEARDKVEQLIAQARKHAGVKPGTQAKALQQ